MSTTEYHLLHIQYYYYCNYLWYLN